MNCIKCRSFLRLSPCPFAVFNLYQWSSTGLSLYPKLFADDTSLFLALPDMTSLAIDLNNNLWKINNREYQWKKSFDPDPSKQAQKVILSSKNKRKKPSRFNF